MDWQRIGLVVCLLGGLAGFTGAGTASVDVLKALADKLIPLAEKKKPSRPGDWLACHRERGQSFEEYVRSNPVRPDGQHTTIYLQLIGEFTEGQKRIVELTADFLSRFYGVPVKSAAPLSLGEIPAFARRVHPAWGEKQILTTYILYDVLKPRLPRDAVAFLGFTASDLWPGPGWNFVFGQASLRDRVGVWSIHRNGNADGTPEEFRLCLLRTLKTAAHETGHMLGMQHCVRYECGMNGSNSRAESDGRPLAFCPECVLKVWWATHADPVRRYRRLIEFCEKCGLHPQAERYRRMYERLARTNALG